MTSNAAELYKRIKADPEKTQLLFRQALQDPQGALAAICSLGNSLGLPVTSDEVKAYMAGIDDEDKFDAMASNMTRDQHAKKIKSPSLTIMGEYDPLNYMEDGLEIWEQINGPKELWILEDDFHSPPAIKGLGGNDVYFYMADWLKDAFAGKIANDTLITRVIPKKSGAGAYEPPTRGVYLPDRLNIP